MKNSLSLSLLFIFVAIIATACGASATPTARPATPTLVAVATLTPAALPSATVAATATLTPTVAATATVTPTANITPTRTTAAVSRSAATATPRVSPTTAFKPPALRGNIAYHNNKDGVDRTFSVNLEVNPYSVTPLFEIGPVMDLSKGTNGHWGAWSPDNSKFAYIKTSGMNASQILRITDLRTNENRDLDSSEMGGGGLSSPTWAPTGDKVAYIKLAKDDRVWSVHYVFYNQTTDPADRKKDVIAPTSQGMQFRGGLSWGKDSRLAIMVNTTGAGDVFVMNQDGSGLTPLASNPADDTNPEWSPDGKQIAFVSTRAGNAQIYLMNADGTNVRRLSNNTAKEFSPSWSSDGNWIAFTSTRDGGANIFVMDKFGGNVTRITTDGGDNPVWSR